VAPDLELCGSAYDEVKGADALVIATEMGRFPRSRLGKDSRNDGTAGPARWTQLAQPTGDEGTRLRVPFIPARPGDRNDIVGCV
jgi:hypothetical protein